MYRTKIHRNIKLSEAQSLGKPTILHNISSLGSQDYLTLAAEVISHNS